MGPLHRFPFWLRGGYLASIVPQSVGATADYESPALTVELQARPSQQPHADRKHSHSAITGMRNAEVGSFSVTYHRNPPDCTEPRIPGPLNPGRTSNVSRTPAVLPKAVAELPRRRNTFQ